MLFSRQGLPSLVFKRLPSLFPLALHSFSKLFLHTVVRCSFLTVHPPTHLDPVKRRPLPMKKTSQSNVSYNENLYLSIYKTDHLSPTLEVLYQESVRGNHILFSPKELERWSGLGHEKPSDSCLEKVGAVFAGLFEMASYRDMCESIDAMDERDRFWLYRLYLNFIESLKIEVRAACN